MNKELEQRTRKLPQWAQQAISRLQHNNAALRAERGKIADGDAKITFTVNFDEIHGVPSAATVTFWLDDDAVCVSLSLDDDKIRVRSSIHRLIIEPEASNVINLSVRR